MTYLRTLFAAAAVALVAAPALAQDYYYDEEDDIIVEAPGVYRDRVGRSPSGIPIEEVTLHRVVSSDDLDLRYSDADVDELYRRIDYTVREACDDIEHHYSQGAPITTERECVREATRDAYAQADELVYERRS